MDDPAGPDPVSDQPLRLTAVERAVLDGLENEDKAAEKPRLARTYRRLIELSRSDDEVDAVLTAHLIRELLYVLPLTGTPLAASVPIDRRAKDYKDYAEAIAQAWPSGARDDALPPTAIAAVLALLEEHKRASMSAAAGPDAFIRARDPGHAPYVPVESIRRWRRLSGDSTGFSHRIREMRHDLPPADVVRRVVAELTAALLGVMAPWFVSIGEVDRLLSLDDPNEADARIVIQILSTPSQLHYFYSRADERWLDVMAMVDLGMTQPPDLVPVEGGLQAPGWPQGLFLKRIAAAEPDAVAEVVSRLKHSDNYRVIDVVVDIARELPAANAVRLLPSLKRRIERATIIDFVAVDVGKLVQRLGDEGYPSEGAGLLATMAKPLATRDRRRSWDLEQLVTSVESVADAGAPFGSALYGLVKRAMPPPPLRKYSTMWLPNIDRKPRHGADAEWLFANALYRFLLATPLPAAAEFTAVLLSKRETVAHRIALAAIADRPNLLVEPDALLDDVARWDDQNRTRFEFRRALSAIWPLASKPARAVLLTYATDALEAETIIDRAVAAGVELSPYQVRRDWRARLLYRIASDLPRAWLRRYGPLPEIDDDRPPEMTVEWQGTESPIEADELRNRPVSDVLEFLSTWSQPIQSRFHDRSVDGLAATAGEVVPARLAEFASEAPAIADLRPAIVGAITSGVERAIRADSLGDPELGVAFVLDVVDRLPANYELDWYRELLGHAAGCIETAAHKGVLSENATARALAFLRDVLGRGPAIDWHERGPSDNWDAGMVALNTVRGKATTALAEILIEAGRQGRPGELDKASAILRSGLSHADGAIPIRAAMGIRLPWILAHDADRQAEWIDLLFGAPVESAGREACWQAYLLYSSLFRETVVLLERTYLDAVNSLEAHERDEPRRPRDDLEKLGIHVAWAHLLGIPAKADGSWLVTFYGRAPDWVRARVTRWIAEQAAGDDISTEVRDAARAFLRDRVTDADAARDQAELEAMSWCASSTDRPDEVLEHIVLPALSKTAGRTENERGATELVERTSAICPAPAARALYLLVDGDEWHSLPHVASEPLRRALESLMASQVPDARASAEATIHVLGAQGFLGYRDLLDLNE